MEAETVSDMTASIELAVDIVAAYLSNNRVAASDLPGLIASTHAAVAGLAAAPADDSDTKATPAAIRKSITPDLLISFEDGKPYKTLRRHLTLRGLSPDAYRAKHGLPGDYPMTSASYSAKRSELARSLGLGLQRRKSYPKAANDTETVAAPPAKAPKAARFTKAAGTKPKASAAKARKSVEPAAVE